jgi:hypothetical protein
MVGGRGKRSHLTWDVSGLGTLEEMVQPFGN